MVKVFVYGTLKPGGRYHQQYCAKDLVTAIPALTQGRLYDFPQLGYPGMTPGRGWVQGYLLTFRSEQVLSGLDELEGYNPTQPDADHEYWREQVTIFDFSYQAHTTAWVYLMTPAQVQQWGGQYLADGNWSIANH